MKCKVTDYFPTSLLEAEELIPIHLNDEVREYIEMLRDLSGKPKDKSWHSDFSLLLNPVSCMAQLRDHVDQAFDAFCAHWMKNDQDELGGPEVSDPKKGHTTKEMWSWAVIQKAHDYVPPHVHPDATFSCVYYCHVPKMTYPEGHLEFLNPVPGASVTMPFRHRERLIVEPKSRMLVIFPAYFQHWVHPFKDSSSGDRISLGFDIRINTDYKVEKNY